MMKRIFDIVVAALLLVLLSPLMLLTALIIALTIGRPTIFAQRRPGLHGQIFTMYKFRSMTSEADTDGNLLSDEERITAFGRFMRAASIDELPELFNVLKGDMSLVGPRPLLPEYLSLYSERQAKRHNCLPGITGWAQVNGRNALEWQEKFEADVWYVENRSFWLDVKILFLTLGNVVARKGINSGETVGVGRFRGNSDD